MDKIKLSLVIVTSFVASSAFASSHREAPLITEDPTADSTDVYAFRSLDDPSNVTLIANYIPFEEPAGGPNFHRLSRSALYEINVDNTGDAVEDISFQFRFRNTVRDRNTFLYNTGMLDERNDPDRNVIQTYTLTRVDYTDGVETGREVLVSNAEEAGPRIGPRSNGDQAAYEAYAAKFVIEAGPGRVFVGPRDDGFYVDVAAVFDLLNVSRAAGLGTGEGVDSTSGYNVHSLAIEMPISALTADGQQPELGDNLGGDNAVIGVWTTCIRPQKRTLRGEFNPSNSGPLMQVSRLALPLVNELIVPLGFKDRFNRSQPSKDLGTIAGFITDPELSMLLNGLYDVPVPSAPRADLVQLISFLPGMLTSRADLQPADILRLNVAIPQDATDLNTANHLGVIGGSLGGFPNGRRPGDDVVDILERVVGAGILSSERCATCTDASGAPTTSFAEAFPGNALNDGVAENDVPYLNVFPYLGTPHEGFNHKHH